MNEKVKEFLDAKKEEELKKQEELNKKQEEAKRITLIGLGLFEKEYSPDNKYSEEFCCSDWDSNATTNKFYKKVPVEITDEEYEEVKKYTEIPSTVSDKNLIATILRVIGFVVYVVGFIASFFLGVDRYGDISAMVIVWWIVFFVSGTFYLGFAEIIQLLDDIKRK